MCLCFRAFKKKLTAPLVPTFDFDGIITFLNRRDNVFLREDYAHIWSFRILQTCPLMYSILMTSHFIMSSKSVITRGLES